MEKGRGAAGGEGCGRRAAGRGRHSEGRLRENRWREDVSRACGAHRAGGRDCSPPRARKEASVCPAAPAPGHRGQGGKWPGGSQPQPRALDHREEEAGQDSVGAQGAPLGRPRGSAPAGCSSLWEQCPAEGRAAPRPLFSHLSLLAQQLQDSPPCLPEAPQSLVPKGQGEETAVAGHRAEVPEPAGVEPRQAHSPHV